MMWPQMWLNRSIATINAILKLLDIYKYRYVLLDSSNKENLSSNPFLPLVKNKK